MATSECFASVIAPLSNDADIVEGVVREVGAVLKATDENYELGLG